MSLCGKYRWWLTLFLIFAGTQDKLYADDTYARMLEKLGFEDVRTRVQGNTLYIAMENTAYRGTFGGWAEALRILDARIGIVDSVVIVALKQQVPQVRICARVHPLEVVEVDYDISEAWRILHGVPVANSSFGKIDWVFYPQVSLANHRYDIIYEGAVNLAPAFEVSLWKGAQVTAQVVIPVWNNISGEADRVRPGFMTFSQTVAFHPRLHATGGIGLFNNNRAGVCGSLEYRLNNCLSVKGRFGLTGKSSFEDKKWNLSTWRKIDGSLGLSYFEACSALQFEGSLNRYVYGYYGARADITRHFRDYAIGVYGIAVEGGYNAGFHFAIPMQGKKAYRRKWFRAKLPDYFDWEYNVLSNKKEWSEDHLKSYDTRPDENHSDRYWQAEYIQRNINREIGK